MLKAWKMMRPCWPALRSAAPLRCAVVIAAAGLALSGCSSALEPFVGKSKEAADRAKPQVPPPAPPPTASFVADNDLVPGFAGRTILPPTLATADIEDNADDTPAASGPHRALVAVPLSADTTALAMLNAAVKREAAPDGTRFVLLVLSPPATDAATLDRNTTKARQAATSAVKVLGDAGVPADHVEVSLATSPNAGDGELRLYRR
jgi:hypothetical protein